MGERECWYCGKRCTESGLWSHITRSHKDCQEKTEEIMDHLTWDEILRYGHGKRWEARWVKAEAESLVVECGVPAGEAKATAKAQYEQWLNQEGWTGDDERVLVRREALLGVARVQLTLEEALVKALSKDGSPIVTLEDARKAGMDPTVDEDVFGVWVLTAGEDSTKRHAIRRSQQGFLYCTCPQSAFQGRMAWGRRSDCTHVEEQLSVQPALRQLEMEMTEQLRLQAERDAVLAALGTYTKEITAGERHEAQVRKARIEAQIEAERYSKKKVG